MFSTSVIHVNPDNAVVNTIAGNLHGELQQYFLSKEKDMDEQEITAKLQFQNEWYGIVDGDHTWLAVVELDVDSP